MEAQQNQVTMSSFYFRFLTLVLIAVCSCRVRAQQLTIDSNDINQAYSVKESIFFQVKNVSHLDAVYRIALSEWNDSAWQVVVENTLNDPNLRHLKFEMSFSNFIGADSLAKVEVMIPNLLRHYDIKIPGTFKLSLVYREYDNIDSEYKEVITRPFRIVKRP